MSAIDDIRKQVVQHLLEWHYKAKERGEEFFFTVETLNRYDRVPYYLEDEIGSKSTVRVLLYGKWDRSLVAYLLIDESSRVFLIGEFDAQYEHEVAQVANGLRQYFSDHLNYQNELRFIHGQSVGGSFTHIKEIIKPESLVGKIDYFLNEIKPEIDRYIEPVKTPKFSYYFFNHKQFDEYLAAEPNYTPPSV
ncbi:hypothetical protein VF12_41190, partial [Nostoc linckia z15]